MRKYYYLCSFLFVVQILAAQPQPCEEPAAMTSFCADACIICDIDGFEGRHDADIVGESPARFAGECTNTAHNMQWIAFIAGSVDLRVSLAVSNCDLNIGLEFGLYKGIDCDNYERISNCFGGMSAIRPGSSGVIQNTEPLVIGQYYYIVMDGGLKDNCDWTFNVLEGNTQLDPLLTSGSLAGHLNPCINVEQLYTVNAPVGATEFNWQLDGRNMDRNAPSLPITFDQVGTFTLCVTSFNACDQAPPTCQTIVVKDIPPTFFDEKICEGDDFQVADTILNSSGNFVFNLTTDEGCDSMIIVDLEAVPASFTDLGRVNICDGDALPVAGENFNTTGIHEKVLPNFLGCDSTITFDLFVVICNIQGAISAQPVSCFGEANGSISFAVTNGSPPFNYNWESLGGAMSGNGTVTNINENISIPNLPAGTYLVTVDDGFGNQRILIQEVTQPDELSMTYELSDFNDFNISCFENADGSIEIIPAGGTGPYTYLWDNNSTNSTQQTLTAGNYQISITDNAGCQAEAMLTLTQPTPLDLTVTFSDPNCDGLATGMAQIETIIGGVPPYNFSLNNGVKDNNQQFDNLAEGNYNIIATDANGCEMEEFGELIAPIIPTIDLGADLTIGLADEISLEAITQGVETAIWRADTGLSCYNCLMPIASPTNQTTYSVTVNSADNCTASDSISIRVLKIRDVFVPNVFSPNNDGSNDQFFINAGPEANNVQSLRIFSRWGELVFEQLNFTPNDPIQGWNGTYQDQLLDSGVYIWQAAIDFIDGETVVYTGDVALVK